MEYSCSQNGVQLTDKNFVDPIALNFFRSKTRTAILVQFMLSSKDRFFMRELQRMLKISIGNLRRELINLEKLGLLKSEKVGNLKFYSLDKDNPTYKPIRELVIKTAGIPTLLEFYILPNKNIKAACVYGSYAKGSLTSQSDIDLLVITEKNSTTFEEINSYIDKLEQRFGREINVDLMTEKEFQAKLQSKSSYIQDITQGKKIIIKGGNDAFRLFTTKKTTD